MTMLCWLFVMCDTACWELRCGWGVEDSVGYSRWQVSAIQLCHWSDQTPRLATEKPLQWHCWSDSAPAVCRAQVQEDAGLLVRTDVIIYVHFPAALSLLCAFYSSALCNFTSTLKNHIVQAFESKQCKPHWYRGFSRVLSKLWQPLHSEIRVFES